MKGPYILAKSGTPAADTGTGQVWKHKRYRTVWMDWDINLTATVGLHTRSGCVGDTGESPPGRNLQWLLDVLKGLPPYNSFHMRIKICSMQINWQRILICSATSHTWPWNLFVKSPYRTINHTTESANTSVFLHVLLAFSCFYIFCPLQQCQAFHSLRNVV